MDQPLVNIVVLTMNHEKYIEQALRSCIDQDYPNKEIVLFDNGSIDSTFEIGKALLEKSGVPFKAVKMPKNIGICNGLNTMLREHSRAEYVCFNSGDDWMELNNVSIKMKFLMENREYRWVYSVGYIYFEKLSRTQPIERDNRKSGYIFADLLKENIIYFQGTIFEKKLIEEMGYFDPTTTIEDWDFSLKAIQKNPIGFIDQCLFYYRLHGSNYSRTNTKKYYSDCLNVIRKYKSNPLSKPSFRYWNHLYITAIYREDFTISNFLYLLRYAYINEFYFRTAFSYLKKLFRRKEAHK